MKTKQLIIAWLVGIYLLGGCSNFSLKGGQARFTFPFDFPQKNDTNQTVSE